MDEKMRAGILDFLKERTAQRQCTVDELIRELESAATPEAPVVAKKPRAKKRAAKKGR